MFMAAYMYLKGDGGGINKASKLKIGSIGAKGIRKKVPILQVGGSSSVSPTPHVFRLVLIHIETLVKKHISTTVHI